MRFPSSRSVRPLLVLLLLASAATVAGAQETSGPSPAGEPLITLSADERAVYVGVYEARTPERMMRIHIYESGDRLMGRPEGEDEPSPLTPLGEHRFRPDLVHEAVITFTVEAGRATRFTIVFPDERGTLVAVRAP